MTKTIRRLFTLIAALAVVLVVATTARAQATWTHTFDFAYGPQGWYLYEVVGIGQWTGSAWATIREDEIEASLDNPLNPGEPWNNYPLNVNVVWIRLDLPATLELSSVYMDVDWACGTHGLCKVRTYKSDWEVLISDRYMSASSGSGEEVVFDLGGQTHTNESGAMMLSLMVDSNICYPTSCETTNGSGVVHSITMSGPGETDPFDDPAYAPDTFYRPVKEADTTSILTNNQNVMTTQNANVYAMSDGTIFHAYQVGDKWNVVIDPGSGDPDDFQQYYLLGTLNGTVGDTITAGCVLGTAGAIDTEPPGGFLSLLFPEPFQTDWPEFPDSPLETPCDSDQYATEHCIDLNPGFIDNAKFWQAEGNVEVNYQGVTLNSNGAVYQDVVLDPEETYAVSLYVTTIYGVSGAPLDITFGDAVAQVQINSPSAYQFIRIDTTALDPGEPDTSPATYRLKVKNTGTFDHPATPVVVKFVCISTTVADYAPGACYFGETGVASEDTWSKVDATAFTFVRQGRGGASEEGYAYDLDPDGYIYQPISISAFATADTVYHLTVQSDLGLGPGAPLLPPYGRLHVYVRDSTTHDLVLDIGEWDMPPIIKGTKQLDFTIDAAESLDGELVIENTSSEIDSTGWHESVYSVCLAVEGGVWPGYVNIANAPFAANCTAEPVPPAPLAEVTADGLLGWIVAWLAFGWDYLGYLIRCQLFTLLNWLWATILSIRDGIALFGVWLGMVIRTVATWAWTALSRRFAEFIAWLIPIINTVLAWLLSLPFIQSLIDTAGVLAVWAAGLWNLMIGVLTLFLAAPRFIIVLFNIFMAIWAALIAGFSATSTLTFPLPDCTNPASFAYDGCLVFDVFNFMVEQVPAIAVFFGVVVLAIHWRGIKKAGATLWDALT